MTTQYPITTVGALVYNPKGEILLLKTHKWNHKYGLPGGKIEWGETAENALSREMREETNLIISDIQFVLVQDCIFSTEFYKEKHFIFLNYTCKIKEEQQVILNEEAEEYLWIKPTLALKLDLNLQTKHLVEVVLQKNAV